MYLCIYVFMMIHNFEGKKHFIMFRRGDQAPPANEMRQALGRVLLRFHGGRRLLENLARFLNVSPLPLLSKSHCPGILTMNSMEM